MRSRLLIAPLLIVSTPVLADGWRHGAGGMGQFEGGFEAAAPESLYLSYNCSFTASRVSLGVSGLEASPGLARLLVDGEMIAEEGVIYASRSDITSMTIEALRDYGQAAMDAHNNILRAIAEGTTLIWELPNGTTHEISLEGSAEIASCRFE